MKGHVEQNRNMKCNTETFYFFSVTPTSHTPHTRTSQNTQTRTNTHNYNAKQPDIHGKWTHGLSYIQRKTHMNTHSPGTSNTQTRTYTDRQTHTRSVSCLGCEALIRQTAICTSNSRVNVSVVSSQTLQPL